MRTLKKLLTKKRLFAPQEIDDKTIFHIARRVIMEEYGRRGGENIIPILYKEKKLFLSPRSSLWASEIMLEREHLRKQINKTIGAEAIKEIKITRQ
jgi:predicted nucleic acid-binding Zn ribbon protein